MGDTSLLAALEPHSRDSIQRSDTSGEHHSEKGQTEHFLANREGSAKDLASSVQDGTSSASFDPMSIRVCTSAPEGIFSTETRLNPAPEQNGNQTITEDECTELGNKSNTIPMAGHAPLEETSQQHKLKSDSTLKKHLEVKEVTDTPSLVVSSVSEHNNGRDFLGNERELKTKVETNDKSANSSSFHSFGSRAELPFECNVTEEAMDNSSLYDQGHTDVNNFKLIEKPLKFAQEIDDLEVSPIVESECMASNISKTSLQSEKFDDVKIAENSEILETSPAETPLNTEPGKNICLSGDKINHTEEGTQKLGTAVNESEISDLHDDGFQKLENDKTESGSRLESYGSTSEVAVNPTLNESRLESRPDSKADKFDGLHCLPNMEERRPSSISEEEQSFNISNLGWLSQGSPSSNPLIALVSNDMEGWHRFDIEEDNANNILHDGVPNQVSHQPELWEQLLEDVVEAGLEAKDKEEKQLSVALSGIESPAVDQNFQISFASPGNPFLEGLDRLSNFSEGDGFVFNENLPSSRFSQSLETAASQCAMEGSSSTAQETEGFLSAADHDLATTSGKQEIIAPIMGKFETSASRHGCESQPEANCNSVGTAGSSSISIDVFEAPSFMSLVDPESHQLFEASMPTYDAKSNMSSQENGGEKWVANFDSMMPLRPQISSPQEITRSISLPRVNTGGVSAGEVPGIQSQITSLYSKGKQAFSPSGIWNSLSRKSLTPSASPKSRSSVSSPKLSPLVKKIVQKVQTTPGVARQVLNTSSRVMSPKTADNEANQRPLWFCCKCFFR